MSDPTLTTPNTTLTCHLCKRALVLDPSKGRVKYQAECKGWLLAYGTTDTWVCPVNHTPQMG